MLLQLQLTLYHLRFQITHNGGRSLTVDHALRAQKWAWPEIFRTHYNNITPLQNAPESIVYVYMYTLCCVYVLFLL